jgi:SnoaL-like domain
MDHASAEWMVRLYVEGWKEGNRAKILGSLDPACVIIESDGLTYRGVEKIGRWIDTWLGDGNEVNRWDITSLYVTGEICFFEWVFECTFDGTRAGFEGASVVRFRNGKIVSLREYGMMDAPAPHEWEPEHA